MQSNPSFRNDLGFTLIEVVVSLTIMGLIIAVASAGLVVGLDSWERGSQKIEELDQRFSVERLIQRQVSLAEPGMLKGDTRTVEFTSRYSMVNGPGSLVFVTYTFDEGKVMYTEKDVIAGQTLGDFSKFRLRYLNVDGQGKTVWIEEWDQESLPLAIQVQLNDDVLTIPMVNRQ
jgi:prepilin-type N-terminal cleavage/methylation domain-containing protein